MSSVRISGLNFLTVCALLAGCAAPADKEAMVPIDIKMVSSTNSYHGSVRSVTSHGGEETNPMWTSEISSADFKVALEKALLEAGIYSPTGRYTVRADILELEQPMFGVSLTVTMKVRYNVMDASGRIRMDRTIVSDYTAAFSESAYGVERLRKANEGAARENIALFLQTLGAEARGSGVALSS